MAYDEGSSDWRPCEGLGSSEAGGVYGTAVVVGSRRTTSLVVVDGEDTGPDIVVVVVESGASVVDDPDSEGSLVERSWGRSVSNGSWVTNGFAAGAVPCL